MNKNNMKPFNLEQALKGAKVVTRNGNNVQVHCKTGDGKLQVTIFSKCGPHNDRTVKVKLDGSRYSSTSPHFEDLFMAA